MIGLEHSSAIPLHAQVEKLLRDLIRKPEYQNGALLPDEVTLAMKLGISRGTIRAGIGKLVFEGLLQRKAGVGTRVAPNKHLESGIRAWHSFTREMAAKGIAVQNFLLDYRLVEANGAVLKGLQIGVGTQVWRVDRVRGWNGKPVLNSTSWFHPRHHLKGTEDFNHPLYEVLEAATGVKPHHAQEEFLAVGADTAKARLLQVPRKTPLLLRRHMVFDAGNRPIEFAEVYYVSSRFTLTVDMQRGTP
ncbi:MAG: GntR family transcriptional regulator [Limisphaerales bacterium]